MTPFSRKAMPAKHAPHSALSLVLASIAGTSPIAFAATENPAPPAAEPLPPPSQGPAVDLPPELPTMEEMLDPLLGQPRPTPPPSTASPSTNVAVNLIALLVKKGQLTQEEGLALIDQAEAEAAAAQAAQASPPAGENDVRVTYVPQTVKNELRDQIRQELLAEARKDSWGSRQAPQWTETFTPFGDFRARYEGIFFAADNDNTGAFPNFNAINTGAPFDTSGTLFSPQHNVDQDRNRARIRARFGADILLGDGFTGGLRVATGDSNSPVSPNQSLGSSGGNFSKYALWLDRAFLNYDLLDSESSELAVLIGRFNNPFFSTEVMWDDDLGFDGLALRGRRTLTPNLSTFYAGGLFPVYNTDFNFATNQPAKFGSNDKWLYGAQAGIEWKITEDLTARFGTAYYDFRNIEGRLSSPFVPLSPNDAGDTDSTRPSFAQRGNTYMALRNIVPTDANDFGDSHQYQYYGLATPFRVLTATARLDYSAYDPYQWTFIGEYSQNIAFDSSAIAAKAVNNRVGTGIGSFEGGNTAWNAGIQFGRTALENRGDWAVSLGYRYVESDAVVDGFTDSDFGGGGTNLKGYVLGGVMAVSPNVKVGIKWMSADEIAGPALGSDTLQFDINARF